MPPILAYFTILADYFDHYPHPLNSKSNYQGNIELLFPDELFLQGEELYEKGGVTEMTAIEKNLFSFIVYDRKNYEVEWLRPLSKHQKASCDCSAFKATKSCAHIVAALIFYKISLPEKEEPKVKTELSGSLNITSLLEKVSKEELKSFIKSYAQGDKKLSTALKVHFARKVDLQDNEKKYRSIMDAIVKPATTGNSTIKINDVKSLCNVASEFLEQAKDALALHQYGEAYILTKTTLSKLCYTLHLAPNSLGLLEKNIFTCHDILEAIASKSAAYDNRKAVIAFLQDLSNYSYYPYLDVNVNCLTLLSKLKHIPDNVYEIISNQLWRKREDEAQLVVLCASQILVQVKQNLKVSIDSRYLHLLEKTGELLLQNKYYKEIDLLCKSFEKENPKLAFVHVRALAEFKPKSLAVATAGYFLKSRDLKLVDWLRQTQSNEVFREFRAEVQQKAQPIQQDATFYTQYLLRSRQDDNLMAWMEQQRDFRMLMSVDDYLFPIFSGKITDLYESMAEEFLSKHIGQHAYVFIEELMQHLNKIKAGKVANKIALLIEMKFPHRSRMSDLI